MIRKSFLTSAALALVLGAAPAMSQSLADIDQVGNNNEANVDQLGANNTALVRQEGDSIATADVTQTGDANLVDIARETTTDDRSSNDTVDIDQLGNSNSVTMAHNSDSFSIGAQGLTAFQEGNDNEVAINRQQGGGNTMDFVQDGDDNLITTTQMQGTFESVIQVDQLGDGNIARSKQQAGGGNLGPDQSRITVRQVGNDNMSDAEQSRTNSVVDVFQSGNDNTSTVTQF